MDLSLYVWLDRNISILVCLHTFIGEAKDKINGKRVFKLWHSNDRCAIISIPSRVAITFCFIVAGAAAITIADWS